MLLPNWSKSFPLRNDLSNCPLAGHPHVATADTRYRYQVHNGCPRTKQPVLNKRVGDFSLIEVASGNGVLYEQVPDVNSFSLLGPFLLPLSLRLLLLSTGFVFAL